ncbi:MAG TPA: hypothetical protein VLS89_07955 [Candidatus Nanopelagicales bacterium]|nr:hypothetical protein [Candidatus Nanopelagicales bacterium]
MLAARLSPPIAQIFESPDLIPHGWYPVQVWNAVCDEVARWPNKPGPSVIRDIASFAAQQDLTLAHKVLLKLGTPDLVLRQAGVFWAMYFNGGQLIPVPQGERRFKMVLHLGTDKSVDPGRFTCREAVPGWQETALRLAGARGPRSVHVTCRFEGAPACEFDVTWFS